MSDIELPNEPVTPVPAASVLLLRDGDAGIEVFMQERNKNMGSFAGMLVFPGGKATADDSSPAMRALCDGAEEFDDASLSFRVAAIREAFEECGVLLARRGGSPVETAIDSVKNTKLDGESQAEMRTRLNGGKADFSGLLADAKLHLTLDALTPYSCWTTPIIAPTRFETMFFLAPSPPDQTADHDGEEAVDGFWTTALAALEAAEAGHHSIISATRLNLMRLAACDTVARAIEKTNAWVAENGLPTITPKPTKTPSGRIVKFPENTGYTLNSLPADVAFGKRPLGRVL